MDQDLPKLNKTAERFFKKVQDEVEYCDYCQPSDGGEFVWVIGQQTTLNEIMSDLNVPEKYWEIIAENIKCPNCGKLGFEPDDNVGLEDPWDRKNRIATETAEKKFGKLIDDLQEHIKLYPSLALSNPIAKKIHNEIISSNIADISINKTTWYRARKLEDDSILSCSELGAPENGMTNEGRYNRAGQKVIYLCDSKDGSISEVKRNYYTPSLIWVQEFEISNMDKILDLRNDWDKLSSLKSALLVAIMAKRIFDKSTANCDTNWKPEYYITQFVADCARQAGYNGICYSSTKSYGENIAVFNWTETQLMAIGEPELIEHKPEKPWYYK